MWKQDQRVEERNKEQMEKCEDNKRKGQWEIKIVTREDNINI